MEKFSWRFQTPFVVYLFS